MVLTGQKVILRTPQLKDNLLFWKWINDKKVIKYMAGMQFAKTYKEELKWFRGVMRKKDEKLWTILDCVTRRVIGNLGIHQISLPNRKAVIGLMIGEKAYWGRGFGTDALKTALRYCFKNLKLNKVSLTVDIDHKAAQKCYRKCGFKKVGYLKDDAIRNGKMRDSYLMEIFAK